MSGGDDDKRRERFYADFTGADPRREDDGKTFSISEMARHRAEAEEDGNWEQRPFEETVDIGRYRELAPEGGSIDYGSKPADIFVHIVPANDGPEFIGNLSRNRQLIEDLVRGHFDRQVKANNDNDKPPAIGLSGFAQSGKTAVANYIESKYGYTRQHIAEPLRDMLRTLLRRFSYTDEMIDAYLTGPLKEELIPELGVTSRHAQITIGTEWGRELIHPDLWANLWAHEAGDFAMNDSVRFPNEERAIREDLDGFTILVERPGTKPVSYKWGKLGEFLFNRFGIMWGVHPSERTDLLEPDYVIVNNGTLEELYEKIDEIFELEEAYRRLNQ